MLASLSVTKGTDCGKIFWLRDGDSLVIGRSARTDIRLTEPSVSRQHCRIWVAAGALFVNDLNSKNGTLVNGRRISGATTLADGDVLELGTCALQVHFEKSVSGTGVESAGGMANAERREAQPGPSAQREASSSNMMGAFEPYLAPARAAPAEPAAAGRVSPRIEELPELTGTSIAGYRIEHLIARDAVGSIYRALQVSMERPVTLRVLSPHMTHDYRTVERFIRTARSCGRLNHPNIAQVFDAGEDHGLYFIASEYVDGRTVREMVRAMGEKGMLPAAQAVDIALQTADALEFVHGSSCIHGSINPDNILVTQHGIVKVTNLGHVRNIEESGVMVAGSFGEPLDSLPFVAPEVLADPRNAGPAADIYSLGAVLFFMLSGHPPFQGTSNAELVQSILAGKRVPLRQFCRNLPDDLGILLEGALAPSPEKRPPRAADLAHELRLILEQIRFNR